MPLDAMKDLTRCLHYTDDWEEEEDVEWETVYTDPKVEAQDGTACLKMHTIGDGKRW
jgi:hypothetical protein